MLARIIESDTHRWAALNYVDGLQLPDCWIAAGFVRDAVWDHLHGRPLSPVANDIDVIWFDVTKASPADDAEIEAKLAALAPDLKWSVKNQARMHVRNGDAPYDSVSDAMRSWPETATAVGVRKSTNSALEVNMPFGLEDLFGLRLVPTESFVTRKRAIFEQRIVEKQWLRRYPLLRVCEA